MVGRTVDDGVMHCHGEEVKAKEASAMREMRW